MEYVTLNNGVKMPALGYGVYLVSPEECERCVQTPLKRAIALLIRHRPILTRKAWAGPWPDAACRAGNSS